MSLILAHGSQFTWDEALLVAVPLLVIAALLWGANRRAKRLSEEAEAPAPEPADPTDADSV